MSENISLISKNFFDDATSQFVTGPEIDSKFLSGSYNACDAWTTEFVVGPKISKFRIGNNDVNTSIEPAHLNVHVNDGPANSDFTVWTTVSAFSPRATISIPCDDNGGYTTITGNAGTEVMRFEHDTSAGYDVHDTRVCFNTSVYDKDGNEIKGGGSGGGSKYIYDDDANGHRAVVLGKNDSSVFVTGPLYYNSDAAITIGKPGRESRIIMNNDKSVVNGGYLVNGPYLSLHTGDDHLGIDPNYARIELYYEEYLSKSTYVGFNARSPRGSSSMYINSDNVTINVGSTSLELNEAKLQKLIQLLK